MQIILKLFRSYILARVKAPYLISFQSLLISFKKTRTKVYIVSYGFIAIPSYVYYINKHNASQKLGKAFCDNTQTTQPSTNLIYKPSYSPLNQILHNFFKCFTASLRIIFLSFIFMPVVITLPLKYFDTTCELWWSVFLRCIELSGPSFVKLAQWASTRRDIFSSDFCNTLSILHSSATTHSWDETEKALLRLLGPNYSDIIVSIDHAPLGAGCVAQVHKGFCYIKSKRKVIPVAIKVLHPNIRFLIETDLILLEIVALLVELIPGVEWLNPVGSVCDFRQVILNQIDLTIEANNLTTFVDNFASVPNINFPSPILPFISEDVLIETFHEGEHISKYINSNTHTDCNKKQLAKLGMNALMQMLFRDNLVHIDLHPGNILVVAADSTHKSTNDLQSDLSIVLLDAGLTKRLNPQDFDNFTSLFKTIVIGDGRRAARLLIERSKVQQCENIELFEEEMHKFINNMKNTLTLSQYNVGWILTRLFSLAIKHKIKLESNFSTIMLAIMMAEGLGRELDPEINIISHAVKFLLV